MHLLGRWFHENRARDGGGGRRKARPALEMLESRVVLYTATGNAWPNPQIITISFMPNGTNLGGGVSSNLLSNVQRQGEPGRQVGERHPPGRTGVGAADQHQLHRRTRRRVARGLRPRRAGAPNFGDIRIGGYNFGDSTLALTTLPPQVNNFSLAGDVMFNTGQSFNINQTYDLFTVAMHEFGHALGLGESGVSGSVMWGTYVGVKKSLATDDIEGIQSLYAGARTADAYNSHGASNATSSTAASINTLINTSTLTALVPNLDISTAGQKEWFSFTAPSGSASTMEISAQSSGLSLLAPEVTVYSSNGTTVLATATGEGQYTGSTLTVSVPSVVAGNTYYVMVQGADTTQMGTGDYALGVNFTGGTPPTEASPIVAVPNGNPQHAGGGEADHAPRFGIYSDEHHRHRHRHGHPDQQSGRHLQRLADSDPLKVAALLPNRRPIQQADVRAHGHRGR